MDDRRTVPLWADAGGQGAKGEAGDASSKIAFAHALRGWAALSVTAAHLAIAFWLGPQVIEGLIHLPMPDPMPAPPVAARLLGGVTHLVPGVTSYFSFGPFGVGLFFLISGFVIPFSFRKQSRLGFLAGRVLRLCPTYAAGLTVTLLALLAGAAYYGRPFPYSAGHVAVHYVLGIRDLLWLPSIDGIVWTLEIEIKFYWLCALLAPWLAAGRRRVFAVVPLLVGTVLLLSGRYDAWLAGHPQRFALAWVATVDAQMMVYMLIGTTFHYLHRGWLRPRQAAVMVAVLFGQSTVCAYYGYARANASVTAASYGVALAVFATCYVFRERFRGGGLTGWLADISYPLYAVHAMAGYVLMNLLVRNGVPAEATLAITFGAALGAAWLLHVFVEKPTHRLATRVARALSPAPKPADEPGTPQVRAAA